MTGLTIRPARAQEARPLSDLCRRSKAHWGYDAAFMAASAEALTISPELIASGRALVAEDASGMLVGVAAAAPLETPGDFDLAHLFVEPAAMGAGAGRALFDALVALLAAEGARRLVILADPNAAPFYARMGATYVSDAPSDAIPDRMLPLFEFAIAPKRK
jgi:predicted N-acetyltransferase YhbS